MIHSVGMAALACLAAVFASFMLMDMLRSRPDWAAAWGVFSLLLFQLFQSLS